MTCGFVVRRLLLWRDQEVRLMAASLAALAHPSHIPDPGIQLAAGIMPMIFSANLLFGQNLYVRG
jgi:hypothetical protein